MSQVQEVGATAIFDVTHQCLESFNKVVAQHDEAILTHSFIPDDGLGASDKPNRSSSDFLGLRNSFVLWIDYTGALSLMDSSLDARLQGMEDISTMVIELLEMVLRNLRRVDLSLGDTSNLYSDPVMLDPITREKFLLKWGNVSQAIYSALDRLHFLGVTIRKASAKQIDEPIASSVTEEEVSFRRYIAYLVQYRFPAARKALCHQLGDCIAVQRRRLLLNRRHAKRIAARRVPEDVPTVRKRQNATRDSTSAIFPMRDRILHRPVGLTSEGTKASRPDPYSPALRQLQLPRPPAVTASMSTIFTTQEDYIEYPPAPVAIPGEILVQCPFCLKPLPDRSQVENESSDYWIRHVDEHLNPYPCLFPQCAEIQMCFPRRKEWKAHLEASHSKDWLRKVHTIVWYCDIGHESPETFETELQWRKHMEDLASHSQRKLNAPTQAQLDSLSPRKQQFAMRNEYACPLCEQIPQKIVPLVKSEKGQPSEMYEFVVDHVADHLKSLSLMALPSFGDTAQELLETSGESVMWMNESCKRLLNENSVPRPPSGAENIGRSPLPSETWSPPDNDNVPSSITVDADSYWDKEYANYHREEVPPDSSEQAWLEYWDLWKSESRPFSLHAFETDPVLLNLSKAKKDNSVKPPPILAQAKNINLPKAIISACVKSTEGNKYFVPASSLDSLITKEVVDTMVGDPALVRYIIQSCRKLFAILVLVDMVNRDVIRDFEHHGFHDVHLPIGYDKTENGYTVKPLNLYGNDNTLEAFRRNKKWISSKVEQFSNMQWRFLAPVFELSKNYTFHSGTPLPFITTIKTAKNDIYNVYHAQIHNAHQTFFHLEDKNDHPLVTIKNIPLDRVSILDKTLLDIFQEVDDRHLIRILAIYQQNTTHSFILECGDGGDLQDFWESDYAETPLTWELLKWSLQQMKGLAGAIKRLHYRAIAHRELKPDNILHFKKERGKSQTKSLGTLLITDMGKPTFNSNTPKDMRRLYYRNVKRYQSPEAASNISRIPSCSDDLWALGCIFLEFIIWILCGNHELLSFTNSLPEMDSYFVLDLTPRKSRDFKLQESVKDEIQWIKEVLDRPDGDTRLCVSSALKELLEFLLERIFVPIPSDESSALSPLPSRANAIELYVKLVKICAKAESSYFYDANTGHDRTIKRGSLPRAGLDIEVDLR